MNIHAKFIIICRDAFLEAGTNNLSLIRIFNQVHADRLPYILPNFALVINFDSDIAGAHTLRAQLTDPKHTTVVTAELSVTLAPGNMQVIAQFERVQCSVAGVHTFHISLDDMPLGTHALEIQTKIVSAGQKTNLA